MTDIEFLCGDDHLLHCTHLRKDQMTIALKTIVEAAPEDSQRAIAKAYNEAGERYLNYADGSLARLYGFDSQYSFGDHQTWAAIEDRLHHLRLSGQRSLRLLDLGCGPGTWIRRAVDRAHQMGFTEIVARGVDLSDSQIERAKALSHVLSARAGISLIFEAGDIRTAFSEGDKSVDLCLCLYGVLNHVAVTELDPIMKEIARVTTGQFIATVRTVGSTPTIYVEAVSAARSFHQNNRSDRLDVEFQNGKLTSFNSHLFSRKEVRTLIAPHMKIDDLRGLDLFHGRFSTDPRWNPESTQSTNGFMRELAALETRYSRDPEFMDHATHLLIVAGAQ